MTEPVDAEGFVRRITGLVANSERTALFIGAGVNASALPRLPGLLDLADEYAQNRSDSGDLATALLRVRKAAGEDTGAAYLGYRKEFAAWVSGTEFDVVAQAAVLRAYEPSSGTAVPEPGRWQRVDEVLGEALERFLDGWRVPPGLAALGQLVADHPSTFQSRILTTNVDPLLEIAVRRAGHDATTLTFRPDAPADPADDSIRVWHLHGFWRPEGGGHQRPPLDPTARNDRRRGLVERARRLTRADTVCVVGYSGWDGMFLDVLRDVRHARPTTVIWAAHEPDEDNRRRLAGWLVEQTGCQVEVYAGVDADRELPLIAQQLGSVARRREAARHRVRHLGWERELISEQGTLPPADCLDLLRQLDRRFQWGRSWAAAERPPQPNLLFWPVRLRPRKPSVIHMVQSLAAAAVSARRVPVVVCLDDYGTPEVDTSRQQFEQTVRQWFTHVPDAGEPEFVSLREAVEHTEIYGDPSGAEGMLRPTHPWDVARSVYGDRRPSVLSVLIATKIIPSVPSDQLMDHAAVILHALETQTASRLLTPLTIWSYLHHELLYRADDAVITLGGSEEAAFWQLWQSTFRDHTNHLYNPHIKSLTNESHMVTWSTRDELHTYLTQQMRQDGGTDEGRYLHWLVQNAFLLPAYLAAAPMPTLSGERPDSWAGVLAALERDPSALDVIVDHVCAIYG